jgi:hypothetical protein
MSVGDLGHNDELEIQRLIRLRYSYVGKCTGGFRWKRTYWLDGRRCPIENCDRKGFYRIPGTGARFGDNKNGLGVRFVDSVRHA